MHRLSPLCTLRQVALLAEGVDRNDANVIKAGYAIVALLAEGVDRNHVTGMLHHLLHSRPPRGGRG